MILTAFDFYRKNGRAALCVIDFLNII